MSEIKVSSEGLEQKAQDAIANIRKMKNVLEEQKEIVWGMSSFWEGEGHDTATDTYMQLSEKFLSVLNELEDIPAKLFDIADLYRITEEDINTDVSDLPHIVLE